MKKRKGWLRDYPPEAQEKIKNKICPACNKPNKRNAICCSRECSIRFFDEEFAVKDWKELRMKAIKRDDYTCRKCGKRDRNTSALVGDHIVPIAIGGEEFDIDNVQTLCIDCDKKKTKIDMFVIAQRRRCEKLGIKPTEQKVLG